MYILFIAKLRQQRTIE